MLKNVGFKWQRAPALYYSLFILLGALFALKTPWTLLFALLFLWKQERLPALIASALFIMTLCYIQHGCYLPPQESHGSFLVHITSKESAKKTFQKAELYRGVIKKIIINKECEIRCKVPASLYDTQTLSLDYEYWVTGILYKTKGRYYFIQPSEPLHLHKKQTGFAKQQEMGKTWLTHYIYNYYTGALTRPFLQALTTGKSDDPLLKAHLTQIGCAHLLAISGFHFGIIASFCLFLLRPLFSYKIHLTLVLLLLLCYLLFIGKSASIDRAFIFASCFFLGPLFERMSSPLNTLGVALGISLLLDPLIVLEIGFQLSFLATAAIIILYPKMKVLLVCTRDRGPLLFINKALALNLAVHCALLPLLLLYFHKISIHSIMYNLFFPTLTACTLIAFIIALPLHGIIPPLGKLLHYINGYVTESYLSFAENRVLYEKSFFIEEMPSWCIALLFLILYFIGTLQSK